MANDENGDDSSGTSRSFDDHVYQFEMEMKETHALYFVLFSFLLTTVLILSKLLHHQRALSKVLSEAALVLLISMTVGFFLDLFLNAETVEDENNQEEDDEADQLVQRLLSFSPNIFFMALLPPVSQKR